jgi:hypothetical protein
LLGKITTHLPLNQPTAPPASDKALLMKNLEQYMKETKKQIESLESQIAQV